MYDQAKITAVSEEIKANMLSGDSELRKTASLAAGEYFRDEIRENGIRRQTTPPVEVTDAMLDYAEDTDFPIMYAELAPKSAGAMKVSFETGPSNEVIHGKKTRIEFNRIMTPKYGLDKERLLGYKMPLLDILKDEILKDIMDVEDSCTMAVDKAITGTPAQPGVINGVRRAVTVGVLSDATARPALAALKKGMFKSPGHLQPAKFLMNYSTFCDFSALSREYVGGDMAQDMFINGTTLSQLMGVDVVVTTKDDLIEDNQVFTYADPKYYGGFYIRKDVSLITEERDDIWLNFFMHECVGFSVANVAGVCLAEFSGSKVDWKAAIA